ncbi:uncharacterized protein DS421_13g392200 [Arachis hypogaea]|nr:uncharacterized protein DS421_13g392200 [Arachis hypogaea]
MDSPSLFLPFLFARPLSSSTLIAVRQTATTSPLTASTSHSQGRREELKASLFLFLSSHLRLCLCLPERQNRRKELEASPPSSSGEAEHHKEIETLPSSTSVRNRALQSQCSIRLNIYIGGKFMELEA